MYRDENGEASANYYIGSDGTICAGVSEDRRKFTLDFIIINLYNKYEWR